MKIKLTKDNYACENCHIVSKHQIKKERIDQKWEPRRGFPGGNIQDELHGFKTYRVCKKCGCEVPIKYESDCKLGYCGIKKITYGGGEMPKECPECRNEFSFGKDIK